MKLRLITPAWGLATVCAMCAIAFAQPKKKPAPAPAPVAAPRGPARVAITARRGDRATTDEAQGHVPLPDGQLMAARATRYRPASRRAP